MTSRRLPAYGLLPALLVIASGAAAVPIEWPLAQGGNGHFYEKVANPSRLTWVQAYWEATTRTWNGWPGHLATVAVPQEDSWVWHTVVNEASDFWLGASKPIWIVDPASGWVWITGQPADPIHRDLCLPYDDLHQTSICAAYIVEYEPRNYCLIAVESATWSAVRQMYR